VADIEKLRYQADMAENRAKTTLVYYLQLAMAGETVALNGENVQEIHGIIDDTIEAATLRAKADAAELLEPAF